MKTARSRFGAAAIAAVVVFGVTACVSDDTPPFGDPSSPSASPAPEVSPSAPPTAAPGGDSPALGVSCVDLVSLDTMYAFDPNFGLDEAYSPAAGTPGATAVADGGIACGWVQQTSGDMLEIAAAQPSEDVLESIRSDAGADDGGRVFSAVDGRGVVQAFVGPTWVVATSSYFGSAEDAAPLIDSVLGALG